MTSFANSAIQATVVYMLMKPADWWLLVGC